MLSYVPIFFGNNFTLYWTRTIETIGVKKETKTNDFLRCNNDLEKDIIIFKLLSMEIIKNAMNLVILKRDIFSFYSLSDYNYNHVWKYYKCIITLFHISSFFVYVLCPFRRWAVMTLQNLLFFAALRKGCRENHGVNMRTATQFEEKWKQNLHTCLESGTGNEEREFRKF